MSQITDTDDVPINYLYFMLDEATDGSVVVVRAPGGAGRFLVADDDPLLRVKARRSGTADAFVDIATSPLELDWADPADVDVKAHASAVTGFQHAAVNVRSTHNP